MRIKFTKNIVCNDSLVCAENILSKIETEIGTKIHADTENEKVQGHLSIKHAKNNHTIWVFLYDNDGIHESEKHGTDEIIIKTNQIRIKKFVGVMPTVRQLRDLI